MDSRFSVVKVGPPVEVFALNKAFLDDTFDMKVNLGIGGKVM
jgi:aspartate aminotransferase